MRFLRFCFIITTVIAGGQVAFAQSVNDIPLVDIKLLDATIVVDLRYADTNNFTKRALYPLGTKALVRPEVGRRLVVAQRFLRRYDYRLKIWDAYRPKDVQVQLWAASPKNEYVANPDAGAGSLHSWGVAVDATLTDIYRRPVRMPTDYDDFTVAAMWKYLGDNPSIARHLRLLQLAMRDGGFYGLRSEWWHFTAQDWQTYLPPEEAKRAAKAFGLQWQGETPR